MLSVPKSENAMMFSSFCGCQNNVSVHYSLETPPVLNTTLGTLSFKMHILTEGFIPQASFSSILCFFYPLETCWCACKPLISTSDYNWPWRNPNPFPVYFGWRQDQEPRAVPVCWHSRGINNLIISHAWEWLLVSIQNWGSDGYRTQ